MTLPVDLVLCFDCSGSMGNDITLAKELGQNLIHAYASASNGDVQVGLVAYGFQSRTNVPNIQIVPLTGVQQASGTIGGLSAGTGGFEPLGQVLDMAIKQLNWRKGSFKTIYFFGNETAEQGPVPYEKSVTDAVQKGIYVNTAYYGGGLVSEQNSLNGGSIADKLTDDELTWLDMASRGQGYFTVRNHVPPIFANPQKREPKARISLEESARINALFDGQSIEAFGAIYGTYLPFDGSAAAKRAYLSMCVINRSLNFLSPQEVLGKDVTTANLAYVSADHGDWDLVDWARKKPLDWAKFDAGKLPPEMRDMDEDERNEYVNEMARRRQALVTGFGDLQQLRLRALQTGVIPH